MWRSFEVNTVVSVEVLGMYHTDMQQVSMLMNTKSLLLHLFHSVIADQKRSAELDGAHTTTAN